MVAKFSKFSKKRKSFIENTAAIFVFSLVLFGIIGFFAYQNIKIGQKRADLENQLEGLQEKVAALSVQQTDLQEGIANTQTEEYQEKLLREQGLYKKEGEEVVTILSVEEVPGEVGEVEKKNSVWWKPWTW